MFEEWSWTVARPDCSPTSTRVTAQVELQDDIGELIPYVNALYDRAVFYADIPYLRFTFAGKTVILYPKRIQISGLADRSEARSVLQALFDQLREVEQRRPELQPRYHRPAPVSVLEVYRLLPRLNCRQCGEPACMAFAAKVGRREALPYECPPLLDTTYALNRQQLAELLA